MQILHAGRYGYHPFPVAPSRCSAPINRFKPRELSDRRRDAPDRRLRALRRLAQDAGYDGVEIMGSEGYFINEFLAPRTNQRDRRVGRLAREPRAPRARDRAPDARGRRAATSSSSSGCRGSTSSKAAAPARSRCAGARRWKARAPRCSTPASAGTRRVSRRSPACAARGVRLGDRRASRRATRLPVIATNRINDPDGRRSAARERRRRPRVDGAAAARRSRVAAQGARAAATTRSTPASRAIRRCLDHIFAEQARDLPGESARGARNRALARARDAPSASAVVGAGPAGLACATTLAERGHRVTLFERAHEIGGQFRYAREVPGKEDFHETLRYFARRIELTRRRSAAEHRSRRGARWRGGGFDEFVIASGVRRARAGHSRHRPCEGHHAIPTCCRGARGAGARVAIIGAGGIGFDVATFLTHVDRRAATTFAEWGIDRTLTHARRAAAAEAGAAPRASIYCSARPAGPARRSGKTTGWIHRAALKATRRRDAQRRDYERIDDAGLHIAHRGRDRSARGRHVVICAGQESVNALAARARRHGQAGARDRRCAARGGARCRARHPRRRELAAGCERIDGWQAHGEWGQSPFAVGVSWSGRRSAREWLGTVPGSASARGRDGYPIRVYPDARVEVVVPPRARPREVELFIAAHRRWIDSKRAEALRNRPAPRALSTGDDSICARGRDSGGCIWRAAPAACALLEARHAPAPCRVLSPRRGHRHARCAPRLRTWLHARGAPSGSRRAWRRWPRPSACAIAQVAIRRQRSRWGSCSVRGTISLNCCLLFQRPEVVRLPDRPRAHAREAHESFGALLGRRSNGTAPTGARSIASCCRAGARATLGLPQDVRDIDGATTRSI